jgi:cob(I)alamin adenosyltransferase
MEKEMTIYTRTGDEGKTSLYSGERVPKDGLRMEALGTLDELNAALGLARSLSDNSEEQTCIMELQQALVQAMAETATLDGPRRIDDRQVRWVEDSIKTFDNGKGFAEGFDVPGASPATAALHLARTVARRAERCLWRLDAEEPLNPVLMRFINRTSDLCFLLAVRQRTGIQPSFPEKEQLC